MDTDNNSQTPIYFAMVLLSIAIFLVDLWFTQGVAAGVLYIAVVLLSRWSGQPRAVFVATAGVAVLTIVGFFIPFPDRSVILIGIENRLIALFAIGTTAGFSILLIGRNAAIRQERDFNKGLVETAASIILLVDGNAKVLYYNPFTTTVSGWQLGETRGKDWIETFVPEAERAQVRQTFTSCLTGQTGQDALFSIMTPQQEAMQFSWNSRLIKGQDSQTVSVLLIGQDITPLVEVQHRLVQSERLAAIGQTVASLSHEVRNELHSLQLAVLLLERQVTGGEARNVVERVKGIEKRLTRLFEDIRGFAAPIQLERATVSIAEIWKKAWVTATRSSTDPVE